MLRIILIFLLHNHILVINKNDKKQVNHYTMFRNKQRYSNDENSLCIECNQLNQLK